MFSDLEVYSEYFVVLGKGDLMSGSSMEEENFAFISSNSLEELLNLNHKTIYKSTDKTVIKIWTALYLSIFHEPILKLIRVKKTGAPGPILNPME